MCLWCYIGNYVLLRYLSFSVYSVLLGPSRLISWFVWAAQRSHVHQVSSESQCRLRFTVRGCRCLLLAGSKDAHCVAFPPARHAHLPSPAGQHGRDPGLSLCRLGFIAGIHLQMFGVCFRESILLVGSLYRCCCSAHLITFTFK